MTLLIALIAVADVALNVRPLASGSGSPLR
jgi:hypothetical protein